MRSPTLSELRVAYLCHNSIQIKCLFELCQNVVTLKIPLSKMNEKKHKIAIDSATVSILRSKNRNQQISSETVFVSGLFVANEAEKDFQIGRFEPLFHPIGPV